AIGCEFASMMSDLGTQVTLLEALPKLLPGCDSDVVNVVARSFKKRGIDVRTGVKVEGHEPGNGSTTVKLSDDSVTVDAIVMSIGRRPLSEELGLEGTKVGLDDKGYVEVDEYCRTEEDGVFAVGDVINTPQLAHVGYAEGILVMNQLLGEDAVPVEYDKVPWATEEFIEGWLAVNWEATVPEVAHLIHPHPTLSESFGDSMLSFSGRGLHG